MTCSKCGGEIDFGNEAGVAWNENDIRHIWCCKATRVIVHNASPSSHEVPPIAATHDDLSDGE